MLCLVKTVSSLGKKLPSFHVVFCLGIGLMLLSISVQNAITGQFVGREPRKVSFAHIVDLESCLVKIRYRFYLKILYNTYIILFIYGGN